MTCKRTAPIVCSVLLVLVLLTDSAPVIAAAPPGTPSARNAAGTPTVGPIFRNGVREAHGCTASVITSATHDLILTAAHCITGSPAGWLFVPGYDRGRTPYGLWTIVRAYLPPAWLARQDPQHDYAILETTHHLRAGRSLGVQDVTGSNGLGLAPRAGTVITDTAYNAGIDDRPVTCTVRVHPTGGYPRFACHGYVGGSSGSPWLARIAGTHRSIVRGVIGGFHQGGCTEYTSYSSSFTTDVSLLLTRATHRTHPDTAPRPAGNRC